MENVFVAILLNGILLNNCALQSYLGISTLLGHSDNTKKSAAMGGFLRLRVDSADVKEGLVKLDGCGAVAYNQTQQK